MHDDSSETGEAHLAQQHSEDNGIVVTYSEEIQSNTQENLEDAALNLT